MRYIKLFEEFNEDPVYKLDLLIQGLVKTIKNWFINGNFAKEGLSLITIEPSALTDVLEKNIIFNFTDQQWFYQAILIVPLVKDEEIKNANLLLKKYSMVESNPEDAIKGSLVNQIDKKIEDIQSEFIGTGEEEGSPGELLIMDLVTQMADKPSSPGTTGFQKQGQAQGQSQAQF